MDENPIITKKKVELLQGIFSGLSSSVIIKVLHHPDVAGNMELAGEKLGELLEENPTEGGFVVSDNNKPEMKEAGWERKDDGFNNRYFKIGSYID